MKNIVGIIIMLSLMSLIFIKGIEKQELHECEIWEKQSKEFRGWYSTDWQKDQCSHYKINLK